MIVWSGSVMLNDTHPVQFYVSLCFRQTYELSTKDAVEHKVHHRGISTLFYCLLCEEVRREISYATA